MNQKEAKANLTYDKVKEMYLDKGYKFFEQLKSLNIFGIRLAVDSNNYDDLIGVAYKEEGIENGNPVVKRIVKLYPATTDPGKYWLNHPMNKKGTAILVPGQYMGAYQIGNHHGYTALVQMSPVKVYRDNDKDNEHDMIPELIEAGNFGINIHRSHPFVDTYNVNKYSAGCQVFMNSAEFNEVMELCWSQAKVKEMGNTFTYTLFDLTEKPVVEEVKDEEETENETSEEA